MDCPDIDDILDALEEKPSRILLQTGKSTQKSGQYSDDACVAEEQNAANYTQQESNPDIMNEHVANERSEPPEAIQTDNDDFFDFDPKGNTSSPITLSVPDTVMDLISDFAEQLLNESTSLANYELKERMRETDAIRRRSETSSGAEEQGSSDAVSIAEGTIVSFASVEEPEYSFREEPEEQASEEAAFHDAMVNESVEVIPAEISEYYSAVEETLDHEEASTTDHTAVEEAPNHVEHTVADERREQSMTEQLAVAEGLPSSEPAAAIDDIAVVEEETHKTENDNTAHVEHKEDQETEPEALPTDDGVDVDNEPELESELAALLGGTTALAREGVESAGRTKQEKVVEDTCHAQEVAIVPEEPVDATSEAVEHEPVVEEAAAAASVANEIEDQPVEHRVADVDSSPIEPANNMVVANDHSKVTQQKSSTTTEHSKQEQAHEGVSQTTQVQKRSVIASTHDISVVNEPKLTESELQLGKVKPYWIPDEDCPKCMLCQVRFTLVNRRHHCRSCGRVLCASCCALRRALPYMEDSDKRKQRVCEPCSRTLDRIEALEKAHGSSTSDSHGENSSDVAAAAVAEHGPSGIFEPIEGGSAQPEPPTSDARQVRKKSVLKTRKPESDQEPSASGADSQSTSTVSTPAVSSMPKRRVAFPDGVNPGDDVAPVEASEENGEPRNRSKKPTRKPSRRTKEKRADEESINLIEDEHLYLVDESTQLVRTDVKEVAANLSSGGKITVALKRNFHVVLETSEMTFGEVMLPVWSVCTIGLAAIGVDEVLLIWEADHSEPASDDTSAAFMPPLDVLRQVDNMFMSCLTPTKDTIDDKVGIRRCSDRMTRLYAVLSGRLAGIEVAAILLHRPQGQDFCTLTVPQTPFYIGTFVKNSEMPWAISIPNRFLYRLGIQSSYYPTPVVNKRRREPVYSSDLTQTTVLKFFNDYRNWNYRLAKIPGSYAALSDQKTEIVLPSWAREEVATLLQTNRNQVAWALDFNDRVDSQLVCVDPGNGHFQTQLFANKGRSREVTGASFVIFDGALKSGGDEFSVTVVEDGVQIRLQTDTMEELVKNLAAGEDFNLRTASMHLNVAWRTPRPPQHLQGALVSPIDGQVLAGKYQYGLVMNRQFRSQNTIPGTSDWAMRLATVINMDQGKFPSALQPKYFEICEHVAEQVTVSCQPFLESFLAANQRIVAIRVQLGAENFVGYETAKWEALQDEHYVWTVTLDDQLVPILYNLCSFVPNGLHVELHLHLISTRPIPKPAT